MEDNIKTISAAQFRKDFFKIKEPVRVFSYSNPIGIWNPEDAIITAPETEDTVIPEWEKYHYSYESWKSLGFSNRNGTRVSRGDKKLSFIEDTRMLKKD